MSQRFSCVIYVENGDDSVYLSHCPEVDLMTQGDTIPEAEAMLVEAVESVLELMTPESLKRRITEGAPSHPEISEDDLWCGLTEITRGSLDVDPKLLGALVA